MSSYVLKSLNDLIPQVVKRLEVLLAGRQNTEPKVVRGISTGFIELDAFTGGLRPGELTHIVGDAETGKTSFALTIAEHVAVSEGRSVAIFSKMSEWEVTERLLSLTGAIETQKVRSGKFSDEDWDSLTVAMSKLHGAKVRICESESMGSVQLKRLCREMRDATGTIGLVVVDTDLQCMTELDAAGRHGAETNLLLLKAMAKELDVPVVVVSNLYSPSVRHEDGHWLSWIRGYESDWRDEDWILLLHRDDKAASEAIDYWPTELIVSSPGREPMGTVPLLFDTKHIRFMNRDE